MHNLVCSFIAAAPDSTLYALAASYQGPNFFDAFTWETFDDPTHGRVNYVDVSTARARNLSFASEDTFVMRTDAERVVQPGARGRDSVRIRSRDTWEEGVYVLDVAHMPTGCATWPAFWTVTKGQWPAGGEIDIIEGVNLATHNVATLHTAPKCDMNTANRTQRGRAVSTDCDTNVNSNQGCGTMFVRSDSYGAEFNKNGGGYYVMERTSQRVSVWFWGRNDSDIPDGIITAGGSPPETTQTMHGPTSAWGQPDAVFEFGAHCDYGAHFGPHSVVFDLTLCGDWAGTAFGNSGCGPSSCEAYVDNNPGAFTEAHWEINSLRIYVPDSDS
ncbi:glycoside hydrolase family 16 protein [Fistulina hepatica ATCC 64428]|uniref:Glycoside hydrolase family 16 protein n=1 Tax=Fistulina hepatica ATCC 64428 TaxID=1128425 RepID=A0A0D7A1Y5_9AGAR|nr:glycoside hydrolase family 16 protein [Fistulina hepatica ATCC 64428]